MLDDQTKVKELMRKMETQLPISARPTGILIRLMKQHGAKLTHDQELSIKGVFYLGDEGRILCDVTEPGQIPMVCSITQLEISLDHSLAGEIQAYQKERARKIAQTNREAGSIYIPYEPDSKSGGAGGRGRWGKPKRGKPIKPGRRKRRRR